MTFELVGPDKQGNKHKPGKSCRNLAEHAGSLDSVQERQSTPPRRRTCTSINLAKSVAALASTPCDNQPRIAKFSINIIPTQGLQIDEVPALRGFEALEKYHSHRPSRQVAPSEQATSGQPATHTKSSQMKLALLRSSIAFKQAASSGGKMHQSRRSFHLFPQVLARTIYAFSQGYSLVKAVLSRKTFLGTFRTGSQ